MADVTVGQILRDPSFYALVVLLASGIWACGAVVWMLIRRRRRRRRRRSSSHHRRQ